MTIAMSMSISTDDPPQFIDQRHVTTSMLRRRGWFPCPDGPSANSENGRPTARRLLSTKRFRRLVPLPHGAAQLALAKNCQDLSRSDRPCHPTSLDRPCQTGLVIVAQHLTAIRYQRILRSEGRQPRAAGVQGPERHFDTDAMAIQVSAASSRSSPPRAPSSQMRCTGSATVTSVPSMVTGRAR
jgi:hypothetical protein